MSNKQSGGPPFDKAWEIAEHIFPLVVERCKAGYEEHGDTWCDGRYDALARLAGTTTARLTLLDVVRKLDAYAETGELSQLTDAFVYLVLEAGRRLNAEVEDVD